MAKHIGNQTEFGRERNAALLDAFSSLVAADTGLVDLTRVFHTVVATPATRFYVSERRAAAVVGAMRRGVSIARMNPERREMFAEIYRRVQHLLDAEPSLSIYEATFRVVNTAAPRFYLSPATARSIIYRERCMRRKGVRP